MVFEHCCKVITVTPGAFKAKDPKWNAVREEDMTDEDSESGMPLDRPNKPGKPPLLPPELMTEWAERLKEEKKEKEEDNHSQDSDSEYPSPAEVAAAMAGEPPKPASTEAEPADNEKSSGVPPGQGRRR